MAPRRIFFLMLPIFFLTLALTQAALQSDACYARCARLLSRSLKRTNTSTIKLESLVKYNKRIPFLSNVCWKFHDFSDCERQCLGRKNTEGGQLDTLSRNIHRKCHFVDKNHKANIYCIHKYHSFLEIRCSTFLKEAVRLRGIVRENVKKNAQETCRYLHYHNMCLANTVIHYCPTAKRLFNRFTFRDYFLSFIMPENDNAFSDDFLDYCQIHDFNRIAQDMQEITAVTQANELFNDEYTILTTEPQLLTSTPTVTTNPRKVFESDESLEDIPPDFFYSSAKHVTGDWTPGFTQTETWTPRPVEINFISSSVSAEDSNRVSDSASEELTGITLDPHELLSTIIKIPEVFPTPPLSTNNVYDGYDTVVGDPEAALSTVQLSTTQVDDVAGISDVDDDVADDVVWKVKTLSPDDYSSAQKNQDVVTSVDKGLTPVAVGGYSVEEDAVTLPTSDDLSGDVFDIQSVEPVFGTTSGENEDTESQDTVPDVKISTSGVTKIKVTNEDLRKTTKPSIDYYSSPPQTQKPKNQEVTPVSISGYSVEAEAVTLPTSDDNLSNDIPADQSIPPIVLTTDENLDVSYDLITAAATVDTTFSQRSTSEASEKTENLETTTFNTLTTEIEPPGQGAAEPLLQGSRVHIKRILKYGEDSAEDQKDSAEQNRKSDTYTYHDNMHVVFDAPPDEMPSVPPLHRNPWMKGTKQPPPPTTSLPPPRTAGAVLRWVLALGTILIVALLVVLIYVIALAIVRKCCRRKSYTISNTRL